MKSQAFRTGSKIAGIAVIALISWGYHLIAQPPSAELPKLFKRVNEAQTELTQEQSAALQKLRSEKTASEVKIVRLEPQAFKAEGLTLNIGADEKSNLKAEKVRLSGNSEKGFTWSGRVGNQVGAARFFLRGESGTGSIKAGRYSYNLRPIGGGLHALITRDPSKIDKEEPEGFKKVEQESSKKETPAAPPPAATSAADIAPVTIRVMILYTPAVANTHGSNIGVFANGLIEITNSTYQDSLVPIKLELAHVAPVDYAESNDIALDVERLVGTNDGHIDAAHKLRDMHAADLTVMLIDHGDAYGYAADILANASTAFAVADDEVADWYFTFAHELGHLFGGRHNPEADPTPTPFAYGHGYRDEANGWRTIMAYQCDNGACERVGHWSNPNVTYPASGGHPTGTPTLHHDARVLKETAAIIAGFR